MKTQHNTDLITHALKELYRALKTIRIYPPDHPVRAQLVEPSHQAFIEAMQGFDSITLSINDDYFFFEETRIGDYDLVLKELVSQFYSRFISSITIEKDISSNELEILVDLLGMNPVEVENLGYLQDWFDSRGAQHIRLCQEDPSISEVDESSDVSEVDREIDEESLFVALIGDPETSSDVNLVLSCFKQDPAKVAELLRHYAQWRVPENEDNSVVAERIYEALRLIYKKSETLLPSAHKEFIRNLAASVIRLNRNVRNALVSDFLFSQTGEDHAATAIIRAFSDEDLAELIISYLTCNDHQKDQATDKLKQLLACENQRDKLFESIEDRLKIEYSPAFDSRIIEDLRKIIGPASCDSSVSENGQRRLMAPQEIAASVLSLKAEDYEQITYEVRESIDEYKASNHCVKVLMSCAMRTQNEEDLKAVIRTIEKFISAVILTKCIHELPEYLDLLEQNIIEMIPEPFIVEEFMMMKKRLSGVDNMMNILDWYDDNQDAVEIVDWTLNGLGRTAIENIIQILGVERDMNRRRRICRVLGDIGKNYLDVIGVGLKDERWYVVRNLAMVLGRIRDDRAVEMLLGLASHTNSRVRAEVISSLGYQRDVRAVKALIKMLKDPDVSLRIKAIKRLETAGHKEAAKELMRILDDEDVFCQSCDLKLAAIEGLGRMGLAEAVPILKRYAKGFPVVARTKKLKLKNAAKEQLRLISIKNKRQTIRNDVYVESL